MSLVTEAAKLRRKLRDALPENRAAARERSRLFRLTPEGIAYAAKYRGSPAAKASALKSKASPKTKAYRAQYIKTADFKYRMRRNHLKRTYGLTPDGYQRLFAMQRGVCALCGKLNAGSKNLHIDHDHTTGKIRGLLCPSCNAALGLFRDNSFVLMRAALYLRRGR